MIGALERAYKDIYSEIPMPVLQAAFEPSKYDVSLDERIKQEVILKRVRDDASINGGKVKSLILDQRWVKFVDTPSAYASCPTGAYSAYHIPEHERDHRDIVTVTKVEYPNSIVMGNGGGFMANHFLGGRTLSNVAMSALRSNTYSHAIIYPTAIVKAGNIIKLDPPQFSFIPYKLTVRLRYDEEFVNMDVSSIDFFAKSVTNAVKAYIYQKLIFQIETNTVYRGMEIGIMRDIVNTYADANEKYIESLKMFSGGELLDVERAKNILSAMIGP